MAELVRQLVLDLPVRSRFGAEDFLVGRSNEVAYGLVDSWPDWPDLLLSLQGPAGSGKSHLAAIWAARSGARVLAAAGLAAEDAAVVPGTTGLVIEDIDRGLASEPALFHLLNRCRETGVPVLVTSRTGPDRSGVVTADLLSRLRRAPAVAIEAPDDALLRAVLVKLFVDRQIVVDTAVIEFLVSRIERSFAAAAGAVADLDQEALSLGRRATRAVAAAVLARRDVERDD